MAIQTQNPFDNKVIKSFDEMSQEQVQETHWMKKKT